MATFDETISETVSVDSPTVGAGLFPLAATDTLRSQDFVSEIKAVTGTATETVGIEGVLTGLYLYGSEIIETIAIEVDAGPNLKYQVTLAEALYLQDQLIAGIPVEISENVGLQEVLAVARAVRIAESLGLSDAIIGNSLYLTSISERVGFNDSLLRFFEETISESLGLEDVVVRFIRTEQQVSETVGIEAELTPLFLISATVDETLDIDAIQLDQWIFNPTINEHIKLDVGYLSPNGNFTSWCLNMANGALSEYSNYVFNSFAQLDDKWIGGNDSGLYELLGTDDDGEKIISRLQSGLIQAVGSRFMGFKAAYLGFRGQTNVEPLEFILRIETGDGKQYDYQVLANNMQTTKVNVGKGIRTRYWSFELISTGQDFDLESVEFVPMVANRRV